ncbi:MAG: hypothetical protein A3D31_11200 [Candidatus Fluviicola riflensis]|nr:MAG: hypothetical protein CHH17_15620 [Candidatus Fluviicola riflensis]OGS77556.1 MAG: hypothetical protein A3D31_11200 [Candidatus Fluviicola riflensis]OGS84137.1 MAG: hypothetical protein A3E30_12600 [Fluviicola sp. RIFCSPHIGHO2_12_FULL_43_24]OGS84622.1 MAG: hypothetical protein A2724_08135 [Fluviicola sp. RIFCSPHIGHO2_01_FULL_43_53]
MSWNDQDIDRLFKGAKAPEPAAFQESFWSEMEAMLPEQKRKKAVFWWIASGAVTLVLLAGSVFWITSQPTEHIRLNAQTTPFLGINQYEQVSKDVTHQLRPAAPCGSPVAVENNFASTSYQGVQGGSADIVSSNNAPDFSAPEQIIPEVVSAENLVSNSPEADLDQQAEELVIVDHLPPYVLELHTPYDLEKYNSVQNDCKNLNHCMLEATSFPKASRFYIQASAGIGQSAQHVIGKSDLVHFYTVGGGLYKKLDRMVFTFGANMRVDFTKNILYTTYPSVNSRIDTKYSQLYSFEMPVSMGYEAGRNSIVATVTPGFQTAFSGNQQETQSNVVVRSEQTFGKISNAKTLTMEIGATYWRSLTPNWYMGLGMNVDILKPFNSVMYAGEQRLLPLNGQLSLRRTF